MSSPKVKNILLDQSSVGLFSKEEAATLIASGCPHLHSSVLGRKDPLVAVTYDAVSSHTVPSYPWELSEGAFKVPVNSSQTRHRIITEMISQLDVKPSSSLADKLRLLTEELLSNSIFHAYRNSDGSDKYSRKQPVQLLKSETIYLSFQRGQNGLFLSIKDSGVGLSFNNLRSCFERCYNKKDISQIETKTGGAGLGLYLAFELSTHVKITSGPDMGTC
ncbi:MAG: ATP-binding protein, partial [Deltaproteobacteria bacterium]